MRSDLALLLDMLIAARKILQFASKMTKTDFAKNQMAQSAVIREFQVIGEASRIVTDATKSKYPQIAWSVITGMRHRLIHDYFSIDHDVVLGYAPKRCSTSCG